MENQNNQLNGYIVKNSLFIGIENLGELEALINDVAKKEKELQIAVQELSRFRLNVTFSQQNQMQNQPINHTE